MYSKTYNFLTANNILFDSQYGFHKKHLCEHTVTELVSTVVKSASQPKPAVSKCGRPKRPKPDPHQYRKFDYEEIPDETAVVTTEPLRIPMEKTV